MHTLRLSLAAAALVLAAQTADAAVELIGVGTIPGDAIDGPALPPLVPPVIPHNQAGGFGSAIAYTGVANRYVLTPDRGPSDGATNYADRYLVIDVAVSLGPPASVVPTIVDRHLLVNEAAQQLVGSAAAFDATNSPASLRFDPEGVRVSPLGTLYVSDEYGPFLYEFAPDGTRLRVIPVPDKFLIANPSAGLSGSLSCELPHLLGTTCVDGGNSSGRQANRGMEGLAISPDGARLFGLMQSPLIQDGALDAANSRIGKNVRLLVIDAATGQPIKEVLYQLEHQRNGLNAIVAVDADRFLVLERDGRVGCADPLFKKVFLVDTTSASDVAANAGLPTTGTQKVQKTQIFPRGEDPRRRPDAVDLRDLKRRR
jgi:hypothetical protein